MVLRPQSASERSRTLKSPFAPLPVGLVSFARAGGSLIVAITVNFYCDLKYHRLRQFANRSISFCCVVKRVKILGKRPQINDISALHRVETMQVVCQNSPPTQGPEFRRST